MVGNRTLMLFTREPWPGKVKTRLIPALGEEGATELYCTLLEHQIAGARRWGGAKVELWSTPKGSHPTIQRLVEEYRLELRIQQGDNLGERMAYALNSTVERGDMGVVIGCDVPSLTEGDLTEAFAALESGHDAVFTPTKDGGFALVGVQHPVTDLFDSIEWGSGGVMGAMRNSLRSLGWRWRELQERRDLDLPEDLDLMADIEPCRR